MATKPLLIFPQPQAAPRKKQYSFGALPVLPTFEQQRGRISPKLLELQRAFKAQRAKLRQDLQGADPERVLVVETVGSVDAFIRAVKNTHGLEWLAEWEEDDIAPDQFFYRSDGDQTSPLKGRLYLLMSNQAALRQILHFWNRFRRDPLAKFDRGLAGWRQIFNQLHDIRFWNTEDRLLHTGVINFWRERAQSAEIVPFEVEFWFRKTQEERQRSSEHLRRLVHASQGEILREAVIEEIEYHGAVGRLPRNVVQTVIDTLDGAIVQCEEVMFFRPIAQLGAPLSSEPPDMTVVDPADSSVLAPVVALFDGLPLENHVALINRLIVDDPDNWAADYPSSARQHGTAMASLITRGELNQGSTVLPSPIYVRPILKAVRSPITGQADEVMPEGQLAVDLLHRAVRRIFDGEAGEPPAAPTVRVVNLSIGDRDRLFDRSISPLARLIDWMSWRYNILFIVSAGNHLDPIELGVPRNEFSNLQGSQLQEAVISSLSQNGYLRRLRVPAEAVNALTVGAAHTDGANIGTLGNRVNPYQISGLPSPINPVGFGYRSAVKPEVLAPGGRQLYREKLGTAHQVATLEPQISTRAPGLLVATPSAVPGATNGTRYVCGTSGAAALTSHAAGLILTELDILRNGVGGDLLLPQLDHVITKCLLVHSCSWGTEIASLGDRESVARLAGYGLIDGRRVLACTEQRATLLGCGFLSDGEGHRFEVPLPPSLIGSTVQRAIRLTLAWLTPISPSNRKYRQAALWAEPPMTPLTVSRAEVDGNVVRRGTVQHEVLVGEKASAFVDGARVAVQVNCRADAGKLTDTVPYAIAITLEVAPTVNLPIYVEIRDRLRVPVAVVSE